MSDSLTEILPGQEALAEPTRPTSLRFASLFWLANLVVGLSNLAVYQVLMPAQIGLFAPSQKISLVAWIESVGALGAIVINPLFGAVSDRTTSRIGRRRFWIAIGTGLALLAFVLLANATNVPMVFVGAVVLNWTVNIVLSALTAVLPDQVPLSQRATVGAAVAQAPLVGGVIGLLVISLAPTFAGAYYILAGLCFLLVLVFLAFGLRHEIPLRRGTLPAWHVDFLGDLWSVFKLRDFDLVLVARIFVFMAYESTTIFTLYFLQDAVHYRPATQGVFIFQLVVVGCLIAASYLGGYLSDRMQRRKVFVIGGSSTMAVALLLLALFPTWGTVLFAAVILGLGFGCYVGVDLALVTQVLPEARNRGKDLGIMNWAIFIPLLLTPVFAGSTLGLFHTYFSFFLLAAFCAVIAALLIIPVKSVP